MGESGADANAGDETSAAVDGGACHPGDVETYVPTPYVPAAAAGQGVCRDGDIQAFYDACFGPGKSMAACGALTQPDASTFACASCILTADTSDHYGPLIGHGSLVTINLAGCLELTDPSSSLSCPKAVQALTGCELAACEANCPVHDMASRAAYDACATAADQAGCLSFAMGASCANSDRDGALSAACLAPTFEQFYDWVVPLFCGPPQMADAAAPASDSGPLQSDAAGADAATDARHD